MAHLAESIAAGQEFKPILDALLARQARRGELIAVIAAHESVNVRRFDREALEATVSASGADGEAFRRDGGHSRR
jgi:hypothetical protein